VIGNVPANITVTGAPPAGAAVTYVNPTATDNADGTDPVVCKPASGLIFPLGTTTVTCTATDIAGNSAFATFTVTIIKDTTPPVIGNVPTSINANGTSSAGAVVTYPNPTATDNVDGTDPVTCLPPSNSTFPYGPTTVICTATDVAGNSATASFTVTVKDVTAPTITTPGPITAAAVNAGGAQVSYGVSVSDPDDAATVSCIPASGSTFRLGVTTVNCTASDTRSNNSKASFTVDVKDTTPPLIGNLPPLSTLTYEANSPAGSSPHFTTPSATDNVDGTDPVTCAPASGAMFPLGPTTVTCTATDAAGNGATATFTVTVQDTTPPVLTVPAALTLSTTGTSLPASTPSIATFLGSAVARDIVDAAPKVTNDAPAVFPLGATTVTFTAKDASGNTTTAQAAIVVVQTATFTPPPAVVDRTPPDDVSGLKATGGGGQVTLSWSAPSALDFDHVVIVRSDATGGSPVSVYTGSALTFVDSSVSSGSEYRYVITAYDHAGNRSVGVALLVKPMPAILISPQAGARVKTAPLLAWAPSTGVSYYNVQLFRGGRKILSLWPSTNHVQLPKTWRFERHPYSLSPATYTWYVWPGVGARAAKRYGAVLGSSTFVVG
jgi:hypothetical protein